MPSPDQKLPAAPTPQELEGRWLREVYQPGAVQLTVRAVITGMLLGGVMCLSNLYVFLKTGWSLGVPVTACILAFAIYRVLAAMRITKREFSVLENNAMASVASAAGFMTGGGNMSAVPALLLLTGIRPDSLPLMAWFAVIAAMGVFVAIPLKRQLINIDQLAFPTGTATAETLKSLHHHSKTSNKARYLIRAGAIGAVIAFLRDAKMRWLPFNLPAHFGLPFKLGGIPAEKWTLAFDGSLILFGAGALMSFKTGWSMLLGAILNYGVLGPTMYSRGAIESVVYKNIVQFTLWPAAALLVSSNMLSFAFQWRSIARSFSSVVAVFRKRKEGETDLLADVECPTWWFPAGFIALAPFAVFLMGWLFQVPLWAALVALPLTMVVGIVSSRVTGETDITPSKAMGPMTQLVFGAMLPGNVVANVMTANVTAGVGLHSADLLTDLKSGYLLGANPRKQLFAQLFGVVAGAAVVVPAYNVLVPSAEVLGSTQFPAPSVLVWAGVSRALSLGIGGLHPAARTAIGIAFALGIAITLLERWAPARLKPYIPSPSGVGMAMVVPGSNSIAMFIGASIAEFMRRRHPRVAEQTVVPISSGFIAGESLMGIAIAILIATGVLSK